MTITANHSFRLGDKEGLPWVYVSLCFSLFYFMPLIQGFSQSSISDIATQLGIYLLFLLFYLRGVHNTASQSLWPIMGVLLISGAATGVTPGTNALYGYGLFLAGFYLHSRYSLGLLVTTTLSITLLAWTLGYRGIGSLLPGILVGFALTVYGILLQRDLRARHQQSNDRNEIKQLATIAERERLSRDLHDILGHSLSSIALKAELAEKYLAADKHKLAQDEVKQVAQLCRATLSELRQSVSGLKSYGFYQEIKNMSSKLEEQGYQVSTKVPKIDILPTAESTLCLLLKEACTNILRHSQSQQASLELKQDGNRLVFEICDNGSSNPPFQAGNGINGMRERCQQLNGNLSIDHQNGFCLTFTINNQ